MEAVEADAIGHGRARGQRQQPAEDDEAGDGEEGPADDRPPPAAEQAGIGAGERGHGAALRALGGTAPCASWAMAWTSVRNRSPRCSKFWNWSKEAQAGDSSTTTP